MNQGSSGLTLIRDRGGRPGKHRGKTIAVAALVAAAIAGLAVGGTASAEDVRIEASVDSRNVAVGDNLTLTITVYGDSKVSPPDLSSIDGFSVLGSYTSQNISIVNARMSKSISLQYSLLAVKEGDYTLGPFTVRSGANAYQTEPIAVRVTKGQAQLGQPATPYTSPGRGQSAGQTSGDLVLAFSSVDKKRAYVGEQVTYTLTFAYRVNVQDVTYLQPDHTGFWFEDVGEGGPDIRVINGVKYYAVTKTTAFFPISSGRFTIGESGVKYLVEDTGASSRDPFGMFGRDPFDVFRRREGIAKVDPIPIEVLPLPADGKPSDFSGAVGSFSLEVVPSATKVKVGESVTLSVRVKGQGNVKSIGDLPLPKIDGFRVFAPKSRDSLRVEGTRIAGAKIFDLVLVAERIGEFALDGFSLSYFDPAKGAYLKTSARPVEISVLEGDEATMRALAASGNERRMTKQDIRHIKRTAEVSDQLTFRPRGSRGVVLEGLPLGLALVGVLVVLQRRYAERSGRRHIKRGFRALKRDLVAAEAMLAAEGPGSASSMVSKAIRTYIALRKGVKEPLVDASYVAQSTEIPEDTRSEMNDLLAGLDRVTFAPFSSGADEVRGLIVRAEGLVQKLDETWRE